MEEELWDCFSCPLAMIAVMLATGVGLLFNHPCLRGSRGAADVVGPDGGTLPCATCQNRLRRRAG